MSGQPEAVSELPPGTNLTRDFSKELGELSSMMETLQKQSTKKVDKERSYESVKIHTTRATFTENLEILFVKYDRERKGWLNYDEFQGLLEEFSGNDKLTREQRDRCFVFVNESESGKIILSELMSRMEEAKNADFMPEIKPELLELIMNQPPDQEAPVSDLVEVGWDIIETVRDKNPREMFEILESKGQGTNTKVFKCKDKENGQICALKIVNLDEVKEEILDFQNELAFQMSCNTPYIARYYGSFLVDNEFWILLEYLVVEPYQI